MTARLGLTIFFAITGGVVVGRCIAWLAGA